MPSKTIQFRVQDSLMAELEYRSASPDLAARRDLSRYYAVLDRAKKRVLKELNAADIKQIAPYISESAYDNITISLLPAWLESRDAGYDLIVKVRQLSELERYALVDIIEVILYQERTA